MSHNKEYDHLFKVVIIGASGVGKSSLLNRFADDTFNESYLATIGVDFKFKTIDLDNKKVKLQIWDTAGQERFRTITNAYYKGADAIIIVYDTTSSTSFGEIENFWLSEVENYAEKDALLMLLGNKSDLNSNKTVSTDKANSFAKNKNMKFYETSAKTAECVSVAFETLGRNLVSRKEDQIAKKKAEYRNKKKEGKEKRNSQDDSFESKPPGVNLKNEGVSRAGQEGEKNAGCAC